MSTDSAEKLDKETEKRLDMLENWLADNLRQIKLPELLIEVDNELHFTHPFLASVYQAEQEPESVCHILATINGLRLQHRPFTMARLTESITCHQT